MYVCIPTEHPWRKSTSHHRTFASTARETWKEALAYNMASLFSYFKFNWMLLPAFIRPEPEYLLPLYSPPQSPQVKAQNTRWHNSPEDNKTQSPVRISLM
jgi:hypothetical protein